MRERREKQRNRKLDGEWVGARKQVWARAAGGDKRRFPPASVSKIAEQIRVTSLREPGYAYLNCQKYGVYA
jgi:hypothetical protein